MDASLGQRTRANSLGVTISYRPLSLDEIKQSFLNNYPDCQPPSREVDRVASVAARKPEASHSTEQIVPPPQQNSVPSFQQNSAPPFQQNSVPPPQQDLVPPPQQNSVPPSSNHQVRAEPSMTEKQMRALSRKHLLMMIFDLQEDLLRTREENEKLFVAYQSGLAQASRVDRTMR